MLHSTPSKMPMAPTHYRDGEVASNHDKVALSPQKHETFRAILGSMNFLCMCTRPNIAMRLVSPACGKRLLHNCTRKRILRYLCYGIGLMGITYGRPSPDNAACIKVFSDSDRAAGTTTRRP
jgi:hypothetical protein